MCTYPLQHQKHKNKGSLQKCIVLYFYILSTTTKKHRNNNLISKMPSPICVNTLYYTINIRTKSSWLKSQSYISKYPLQQKKKSTKYHCQKVQSICKDTLYNNTKINIKSHFQNSQSYMSTYPLQKHKHKKISFFR